MDLELETRELRRRDDEWAALASKGRDIDAVLSYWTDDAIVIPPDLPPVVGKAALREYVQASLGIPGFSIRWKSSDAVVSPDGKLAYMLGENRITMTGPDGAPVTMAGRALAVWRKDHDGVWRCVAETWNAGPPGRLVEGWS